MPEEISNTELSNTSSFLGLQSYTEAQANSFFGRELEIDNLTSLVRLNLLTIVFGRSGTGKTSLLNAGVFPKLRKDYYLPFRIRLEFNDDSPDLVTQIKSVLTTEIDKYGFNVEAYPSSETLWEYFHKELLWKTVTPILVFDQFEEIFTLSKSNPRFGTKEIQPFWDELSDLIENNIPKKLEEKFLNQKDKINYAYKKQKTKIVFAFREEYLPEFESLTAKIPSIKTSRFRLMPMNGHQAHEVITKTWQEKIDSAEANQIVSYLTNEEDSQDYDLITIEPSLLSQVCASIDKERLEGGGGKVTAVFLENYSKEKILRSIYDKAISEANNSLLKSQENRAGKNKMKLWIEEMSNFINPGRSNIKLFIEDKLISTEGHRLKYYLTHKDDPILPGIKALTAKYFLHEEDKWVELTHDVLTPFIKADRDANERKKRKNRLRLALILLTVALVTLPIVAWKTNKIIAEAIDKKEEFDLAVLNKKDSLEKEFLKKYHESKALEKKQAVANEGGKVIDNNLIKVIDSLKNKIQLLQNDSASLAGIIFQKNSIIANLFQEKLSIQTSLDVKIKQVNDLQRENSVSKEEINKLNSRINILNADLKIASEKIRIFQDSVSYLQQTIKKQGETINDLINKKSSPLIQGNLRISIFDSVTQKIIHNDKLDVYIIPLNSENNNLLNDPANNIVMQNKECSKEFEYLLLKLQDKQKAVYSNGYYYFPKTITKGEYKIKICSVVAGYYDLKMPIKKESILWKRKNAPTIEIKPGKF